MLTQTTPTRFENPFQNPYRIIERFPAAKTPQELLNIIAGPILAASECSWNLFYIANGKDGQPESIELAARAENGTSLEGSPLGMRFRIRRQLWADYLLTNSNEITFVADVGVHKEQVIVQHWALAGRGAESIAFMPLYSKQFGWVGLITAAWPKEFEFNETLHSFYGTLMTQAATHVHSFHVTRQLTEQRTYMRVALDNLPMGAVTFNTLGQFTEVNQVFLAMTGYTEDELIGMHIHELALAGQENRELAFFLQSLQHDMMPAYETEFVRKDGYSMRVRIYAARQIDAEGIVIGVLASMEDVTEQAQFEASLAELREVNDALGRAMPGLAYRYEPGRAISGFLNAGAHRLLEYDADQVAALGEHPLEALLHPDDRDCLATAVKQLRHGQPNDITEHEVRLRHASGEWRWFRCYHVVLLRTAAGQPHTLIGVAQDIDEQKRVARALSLAEKRYRVLVEDQSELAYRALPNGKLTFVNSAFCQYVGMPRAELIGSRFTWQINGADRRMISAKRAALSPKQPVMKYQVTVTLSNGEERIQVWKERGIFKDDGQLVGLQGIGQDVTRGHLTAVQAYARSNEPDTQTEMLSRLLNLSSHKLSTVISVVNIYLHLLESKLTASDEQQFVDSLKAQVDVLNALVIGLGEFVELEQAGKLVVQPLDLKTFLSGFGEQVEQQALDAHVELRLALAEGLPLTAIDVHYFQTALHKIVDNALAYTPPGGQVLIRTSQPTAQHIMLEIIDSGPGIDVEQQGQVFDFFFKGSNAKSAGPGLGLAYAKHVIEQHGGSIKFVSTTQGTTIRIQLPLAR